MRKTLTDRGVAALKARPQRYAFPDPELTGHYVRIQPSGAKTFVTVARSPAGKQIWTNIGAADAMPVEEARRRARAAIGRIRDGLAAFESAPDTFAAIAEQWLVRHVEAKRLITERQIRRLLRVHVLPHWAGRPFLGIRRTDVAALLDRVEDNHGSRQADMVLTIIRSLMGWYATRHDDYGPPVVRGMGRHPSGAHARTRILADDELRVIWAAAETSGTFGGIVKLALLSGQRRTKVSTMRWSDLSPEGEWTIPKAPREKDTAGTLMLPEMALAVVRAQPRMASNPHVFSGRGSGPLTTFARAKDLFDAKLPADMPGWVIHDLRRTARSLMSRAGVRPDIAERVLGHTIPGVAGIYDRFKYRAEKADALQRLAALIESIIHPKENVLPLTARRKP